MKIKKSFLKLDDIFFEELSYKRISNVDKTDSFDANFSINIEKEENKKYKVAIILEGEVKDAFEVFLKLVAVFSFKYDNEEQKNIDEEELIKKNGTAIMLPYLRSQLTILTSQPNLKPVVMPLFNIAAMLK